MNERTNHRKNAAFAALLTFALLFALTHRGAFAAGNDASRFAHIEALTEQGVPYLENTRYAWTVDRVLIGEHTYTNKPPIMAMAGAGIYSVVRALTGWSFAEDSGAITRLLTLILVGLPSAVLVGVFYLALGLHESITQSARWWTVTGLAIGSILTSYSVTFNNHTPAAAFLFFAFYAAWRGRYVASAALISVTTWIDVLPGIFFIPILMWMAFEHGKRSCLQKFSLTGLLCAIPFFLANWLTVHHLLLPKLVPGAVDQSSHFGASVGAVLLPETWSYPIECLFGGHGFFSVSPILLFGALGLVAATRKPSLSSRKTMIGLSASIAVFIIGHICLAGSYGGWAYGFRYLIPVVPLLLFFVPIVLPKTTPLYAVALALSILMAALGAYHPWPPAYEQEQNRDPIASLVTNPVGGNAAMFAIEYAPKSAIAKSLARVFISDKIRDQRMYVRYFRRSRGL